MTGLRKRLRELLGRRAAWGWIAAGFTAGAAATLAGGDLPALLSSAEGREWIMQALPVLRWLILGG